MKNVREMLERLRVKLQDGHPVNVSDIDAILAALPVEPHPVATVAENIAALESVERISPGSSVTIASVLPTLRALAAKRPTAEPLQTVQPLPRELVEHVGKVLDGRMTVSEYEQIMSKLNEGRPNE